MKKFILLLLVTLLLSGCSSGPKETDLAPKSLVSSVAKETPIDFEVEKNALTYGFQSINPHVEVLNKSDSSLLLLTLGVVQCSRIDVDRVTSFNNEINIYVSRVLNSDSTDIVVPQLVVNLKGIDKKDLGNRKINIIGTNYEPVNLTYNLNQVLNNIYAQYTIASNTTPHVKIQKEDDKYFWNIVLHNSFAKDSLGNPLVNFTAKVDSSTGEVVEFNKEVISSYIDEGSILYNDETGLLFYKQLVKTNDDEYEILWSIEGKEKKKIYTTHNSIDSLQYNSKYNLISLIESNGPITDIYIIDLNENTVQKITPMDFNHTWNSLWNTADLYFVNNDRTNRSSFFKHNVIENKTEKLFVVNKTVASFDLIDNTFVFNEFIEGEHNAGIFTTVDGSVIESIDTGFNTSFINNKKIVYLKKDLDENKNTLWLYDLNENKSYCVDELDVRNYKVLDNEKLVVVGRINYSPEFDSYILNIDSMDKTKLAQTISENLFYVNDEFFYLNMVPLDKSNGLANIYKVDISKVALE